MTRSRAWRRKLGPITSGGTWQRLASVRSSLTSSFCHLSCRSCSVPYFCQQPSRSFFNIYSTNEYVCVCLLVSMCVCVCDLFLCRARALLFALSLARSLSLFHSLSLSLSFFYYNLQQNTMQSVYTSSLSFWLHRLSSLPFFRHSCFCT